MESRERLTRGGVGTGGEERGGRWWKEKEGTAVIDCTACVPVLKRMTRGREGGVREERRAGFAPRAAVKALCPPENTPTSLQ